MITNFQDLVLASNYAIEGTDSVKEFSLSLENNSCLSSFDTGKVNYDSRACLEKRDVSLNLSHCQLGIREITWIAKLLTNKETTPQKLALSGNVIGSKECVTLFSSLLKSDEVSLNELNLSHCGIKDDCVFHILHFLGRYITMTDNHDPNIGSDGLTLVLYENSFSTLARIFLESFNWTSTTALEVFGKNVEAMFLNGRARLASAVPVGVEEIDVKDYEVKKLETIVDGEVDSLFWKVIPIEAFVSTNTINKCLVQISETGLDYSEIESFLRSMSFLVKEFLPCSTACLLVSLASFIIQCDKLTSTANKLNDGHAEHPLLTILCDTLLGEHNTDTIQATFQSELTILLETIESAIADLIFDPKAHEYMENYGGPKDSVRFRLDEKVLQRGAGVKSMDTISCPDCFKPFRTFIKEIVVSLEHQSKFATLYNSLPTSIEISNIIPEHSEPHAKNYLAAKPNMPQNNEATDRSVGKTASSTTAEKEVVQTADATIVGQLKSHRKGSTGSTDDRLEGGRESVVIADEDGNQSDISVNDASEDEGVLVNERLCHGSTETVGHIETETSKLLDTNDHSASIDSDGSSETEEDSAFDTVDEYEQKAKLMENTMKRAYTYSYVDTGDKFNKDIEYTHEYPEKELHRMPRRSDYFQQSSISWSSMLEGVKQNYRLCEKFTASEQSPDRNAASQKLSTTTKSVRFSKVVGIAGGSTVSQLSSPSVVSDDGLNDSGQIGKLNVSPQSNTGSECSGQLGQTPTRSTQRSKNNVSNSSTNSPRKTKAYAYSSKLTSNDIYGAWQFQRFFQDFQRQMHAWKAQGYARLPPGILTGRVHDSWQQTSLVVYPYLVHIEIGGFLKAVQIPVNPSECRFLKEEDSGFVYVESQGELLNDVVLKLVDPRSQPIHTNIDLERYLQANPSSEVPLTVPVSLYFLNRLCAEFSGTFTDT